MRTAGIPFLSLCVLVCRLHSPRSRLSFLPLVFAHGAQEKIGFWALVVVCASLHTPTSIKSIDNELSEALWAGRSGTQSLSATALVLQGMLQSAWTNTRGCTVLGSKDNFPDDCSWLDTLSSCHTPVNNVCMLIPYQTGKQSRGTALVTEACWLLTLHIQPSVYAGAPFMVCPFV